MATITNRDGRWQAKIRRQGYPPQSRTFMRQADAEAWSRKVERDMDTGTWRDTSEAERTTLGEGLARWRDEVLPDLAPSSQVADGNRVSLLMRYPIARISIARLRSADLADFIKERRAEGVSGNTIRLDLAQISRVFSTAKDSWGMEGLPNPVRALGRSKPRVAGGRERRLGPGEEDKLMTAAGPFGLVIQFALATCARRGEIAGLAWNHVNLSRRTMRLVDTKNGTDRTVPLSTAAMSILESLPRRIDGSVFGMTEMQITKTMRRIAKSIGIDDLHFHDLRHEAISRLFERTRLTERQIAQISGHKTAQMLWRYAHLRADDLVEAIG